MQQDPRQRWQWVVGDEVCLGKVRDREVRSGASVFWSGSARQELDRMTAYRTPWADEGTFTFTMGSSSDVRTTSIRAVMCAREISCDGSINLSVGWVLLAAGMDRSTQIRSAVRDVAPVSD